MEIDKSTICTWKKWYFIRYYILIKVQFVYRKINIFKTIYEQVNILKKN